MKLYGGGEGTRLINSRLILWQVCPHTRHRRGSCRVVFMTSQQEVTPETWQSLKAFLRDLPSADSLSRASANTIQKESVLVRSFLSQSVALPTLFLALDQATRESNPAHVTLAANAISRVFTSSIGPALLDDPTVLQNLNAGIMHSKEEVRKLATRVLHKALLNRRSPTFVRLLLTTDVAAALVNALADTSIAVGQHAADALVDLLRQAAADTEGQGTSTLAAVLNLIKSSALSEKVSKDSVLQLRLADLIARVLAVSETACSACAASGASDLLFNLIEGQDVLIQFTAIELLEGIAATPWGVRLLFRRGTVQWLLSMATGTSSSGRGSGEPDPVLGGTSLRLLGRIYRTVLGEEGIALRRDEQEGGVDSKVLLDLLGTMLRYADSGQEADRLSSLQTICSLASASPQALRLILDDHGLLTAWLNIRSMKTEMKAASLHSLAKALRDRQDGVRAPPHEPAPDMTALRRDLFDRVGPINNAPNTMGFFMSILRTPIAPIRYGVYDVLTVVARQPTGWGLRATFTTAGFKEFLESRSTELDKEGREWKYAVVESALQCPQKEILGEDLLESLNTYLRQGPFFSPPSQAEMETLS